MWSKVNYFRDLSLLLDQISQDFSSTWSLDLNRGSFYWKNKRFINRSDLDSIPSQFIFLNPESRFEIATQKFSDLNLIVLNVLTQNVLKQYFRYSNFDFTDNKKSVNRTSLHSPNRLYGLEIGSFSVSVSHQRFPI